MDGSHVSDCVTHRTCTFTPSSSGEQNEIQTVVTKQAAFHSPPPTSNTGQPSRASPQGTQLPSLVKTKEENYVITSSLFLYQIGCLWAAIEMDNLLFLLQINGMTNSH